MAVAYAVYVLEPDPEARRALVLNLREQQLQAMPFSSSQDFIDAIDFLGAGIALIDVAMAGPDGLDIQQRLHEQRLDILAIYMGDHTDAHTAAQLVKHGAADFLDKPVALDEIMTALREAQAQLGDHLAAQQRRQEAMEKVSQLSQRELDVMQGVAAGLSNKDLARNLSLSPRTVEMHRANMMKKIGSTRVTQIIQIQQDAHLGRRKSG